MYPDYYASAIELPFNHHCLQQQFVLSAPHEDPGGDGVWVVLRGGQVLVNVERQLPTMLDGPTAATALYIGQWNGQPCRAVSLSPSQPLPEGLHGHDLMAAETELSLAVLSLGAVAQQLLRWQTGSAFCSCCGGEAQWAGDGWGRKCTSCGRLHFPHLHPCVIVLIRRDDEVLLVRKQEWVPGRYGLVAGFVDVGECLEETVVREVKEETGIAVTNLRYVGSQAWPFPSQIMAGFVADYAGGDIDVDGDELEQAAWFKWNQLPQLPPRRSIARYLIDHWLEQFDHSVPTTK